MSVRTRVRLPRSRWLRAAAVVPAAAAVGVLLWWRGPNVKVIADAFAAVEWRWVVAAIALNLLSVVARAMAWRTVIRSAMPRPHPPFPLVFSAFSVGLFANAVLPGRIGELARVAVLTRKLPRRPGLWATLVGTVFAHRVFDIVPVVLLVLYVLVTAKIPAWAITSLLVAIGAGVALFAFALVSARHHKVATLDRLGTVKRLWTMARHGLGVMREPVAAGLAILFQIAGWTCQLFAVYTSMRAFHIHAALPAAGLVLVLINVATIFPLWPGNIGLVQAAIALPLGRYGVGYSHGFAFGLGLQAIEASVGIGVGLVFLAREGISYAVLRAMPDATTADEEHVDDEEDEPDVEARERAGVS
jgi:uncharacterized membrane protein YbhN (UPF0104 family)